jgi:hypothetical protein
LVNLTAQLMHRHEQASSPPLIASYPQVYHLSFDDAPRFKAVNIVRALLGLRYYVQLTPWAATSPVASIEAAVSGAVDGMTSGPTSAFVENLDAEFERARQRNVCR